MMAGRDLRIFGKCRARVVLRLAGVAACSVVLLAACGHRSPAVGPLREVTVVTDHWVEVEEAVRGTLQRPQATPQLEPEFELRVFSPAEYRTWSLFRTVLLIGPVGDSIVHGVLGPRADSLPETDFALFRVPNPWADNQELLVFAVSADTLLVPGLERYADRIHLTCRQAVLRHVARAVYHRGLNQPATDSLREEFAFSLDVPRSWWLDRSAADSGFVFAFGHYPDRNVFVYWEEGEWPLESGPLFELRDRLSRRYYDGDFVPDTLRESRFIEFLADSCLRLQGIWQNREHAIGGPFVSYGFNHQGRFFLLDGLVFNPGRKKLDGLIQAEAVMRTFTPR